MPYCGFQTFHDNFVAHQGASDVIDEPWDGLPSPCHRYLKSLDEDEALAVFMQSSWIMPNEVDRYGEYFSEMKLATRMHQRIQMIVAAYARKKFSGNLLDLTEPSFSKDFKNTILDAQRLESSYFDRVTACSKNCEECNFCLETVKKIKCKMI